MLEHNAVATPPETPESKDVGATQWNEKHIFPLGSVFVFDGDRISVGQDLSIACDFDSSVSILTDDEVYGNCLEVSISDFSNRASVVRDGTKLAFSAFVSTQKNITGGISISPLVDEYGSSPRVIVLFFDSSGTRINVPAVSPGGFTLLYQLLAKVVVDGSGPPTPPL